MMHTMITTMYNYYVCDTDNKWVIFVLPWQFRQTFCNDHKVQHFLSVHVLAGSSWLQHVFSSRGLIVDQTNNTPLPSNMAGSGVTSRWLHHLLSSKGLIMDQTNNTPSPSLEHNISAQIFMEVFVWGTLDGKLA